MDRIRIVGGQQLNGTIAISGAKNAALFAAALLANESETIAAALSDFRQRQTDAVLDSHLPKS